MEKRALSTPGNVGKRQHETTLLNISSIENVTQTYSPLLHEFNAIYEFITNYIHYTLQLLHYSLFKEIKLLTG